MSLRIVVALAFAFVSSGAFASTSGDCGNFVESVCESKPVQQVLRKMDLKAIAIRKEIFQKLSTDADWPLYSKEINSMAGAGQDFSFDQTKRFAQVLHQASLKVSGVQEADVKQGVSQIIHELSNQVQQANVPQALREKMTSILSKVRVLSVSDLANTVPKIARDFLFKGCGRYALAPYGFQLVITGGGPDDYVAVVCPTLMASWNDARPWVTYVMAHEVGHFIDADFSRPDYERMSTCTAQHEQNRRFFHYSHSSRVVMPEISADYWAQNVLAATFKEPQELKESAAGLCHMMAPQPSHPGGAFRLLQFIANPKVRQNFACQSAPEISFCEL